MKAAAGAAAAVAAALLAVAPAAVAAVASVVDLSASDESTTFVTWSYNQTKRCLHFSVSVLIFYRKKSLKSYGES